MPDGNSVVGGVVSAMVGLFLGITVFTMWLLHTQTRQLYERLRVPAGLIDMDGFLLSMLRIAGPIARIFVRVIGVFLWLSMAEFFPEAGEIKRLLAVLGGVGLAVVLSVVLSPVPIDWRVAVVSAAVGVAITQIVYLLARTGRLRA